MQPTIMPTGYPLPSIAGTSLASAGRLPLQSAPVNQFIDQFTLRPLAYLLPGDLNEIPGVSPSALSAFIADTAKKISGADIALVRSTEVRRNASPGILTSQQVAALLPFPEPLVRVKLSGGEIATALQRSAQGFITATMPLLNPSGMRYALDPVTGQVGNVTVQNRATGQWEALDPFRYYSVALTAYPLKVPGAFPELYHPERVEWQSNMSLKDVFSLGLAETGGSQQPLPFRNDGRINILPGGAVPLAL